MNNTSSELSNFFYISIDSLCDTILNNIIDLSYEENISLKDRAYLLKKEDTEKLFKGQSEDITQLNYLYFQVSKVISEKLIEFDVRDLIVNIPLHIQNLPGQKVAGYDPFTTVKMLITVIRRLEEQRVLNKVIINLHLILPGNLDSYFQGLGGDKPDEANDYLIQFRTMLYDLNIFEVLFQTRGGVPLDFLSLHIKKENGQFTTKLFPFKEKTIGRAINKTYILGTAGLGRHSRETADYISQKLFQDFAFESLRMNNFLGYVQNLPMNFENLNSKKEIKIDINTLKIPEDIKIKLNYLTEKEIGLLFSNNKLFEKFGSISTFSICSIQKPNLYIYRYLKLRETRNFLTSSILSLKTIEGNESLMNKLIAEKIRKVIESLGFNSEYNIKNEFVEIKPKINDISKFIEGCFFYEPNRKLKVGEHRIISLKKFYQKNWLEKDPFEDNLLESRITLEEKFEEFIKKLFGDESNRETIREWVKSNFEDFLNNLELAITKMINEIGSNEFGGAHTAAEAEFILSQVHRAIFTLFFPPMRTANTVDENGKENNPNQYQNLLSLFESYTADQNNIYRKALQNFEGRLEPNSRLFRFLLRFNFTRNLYKISLMQGFPFHSRILARLSEEVSFVLQEYIQLERQKYENHWTTILEYSNTIRNQNSKTKTQKDNEEISKEIGEPGVFYKILDDSENDIIPKVYLDSLMELRGSFLEKSLTFSFQLSRFLSYCPSIYTAVETEISLLEERRNYPNQVKSIFKNLSQTEQNDKFLEKVYENHFYKKRRTELHHLQLTILSYWKDKINESFEREKTHMKGIFSIIEKEISHFILQDSRKLDGDIYTQLKELRNLQGDDLNELGNEINKILDNQIQKVIDLRFKPEPDQEAFYKFQYVVDTYDPNLEGGQFRIDWKSLEMGSHNYPLDSPLIEPFKAGFLNTYIIREIHRIPLNVIKKKRTIDQNLQIEINYPRDLYKENEQEFLEKNKKEKKSSEPDVTLKENISITQIPEVDNKVNETQDIILSTPIDSDGNSNISPEKSEPSFSELLGLSPSEDTDENSSGQSFNEIFKKENKEESENSTQINLSQPESFSDLLGLNSKEETNDEGNDPFLGKLKEGKKFELPDF